ncbi:unnamed protein product [Camellia sinensis]
MRESSIPSSEKEEDLEDLVPTSGISRPLSEILKELNKKVPDSLIRVRTESDGFPVKYIPWHIVNRIMNLHAPEWSGEVRSITYSADGKSVSVVYRVTLYGTDAEVVTIDKALFLTVLAYLGLGQPISVVGLETYYVSLKSMEVAEGKQIYKESTGTAPVNDAGYGDPVQKEEAMAFRRACARFGLGLHLYHEDVL